MKVSIRDSEVLKTINPFDVSTYLSSKSWQLINEIPNKASVWTHTDSANNEFEILLPLNPEFKDFPARISEIISTLEIVESLPQTTILENLQNVFSNIINLRLSHRDFHDGSIPINNGVALHKNARDMMLSAACSSVETKPFFEKNKPDRANNYLKQVRLGQPKLGSYILTIISPLPNPRTQSNNNEVETTPISLHFANRVVTKLFDSLQFTKSYIEYVLEERRPLEVTPELIQNGVTANLCYALTGINNSGNKQGLEMKFNWSPVVNSDSSQIEIKFEPEMLTYVESLGKQLKAYSYEDFEITGDVIKLERKINEEIGKVTVQTTIEGTERKVTVQLNDVWYLHAARANAEKRYITCRGDLQKDGSSYTLTEVTSFVVRD